MATSKITTDTMQSTTISGGYVSGTWSLYKIGKIVFLQVYNFASVPSGSFNLGVTIPSEYRPPYDMSFTLTRRNASADPIAFGVNADGSVACYKYGSAISAVTPYNQLLAWFTK